jgi:hypothetical protein
MKKRKEWEPYSKIMTMIILHLCVLLFQCNVVPEMSFCVKELEARTITQPNSALKHSNFILFPLLLARHKLLQFLSLQRASTHYVKLGQSVV